MPFGAVVFATDFSASARRARAFAAAIARRYGAEVVVVHAFALTQAAAEAEALSHANSAQRHELQQKLVEAAAELSGAGVPTAPVLREGSPADVVRSVAESYGSPLVVLGTHGGGAVERHLLGSVAESILRSSVVPVLTVGPHVNPPDADPIEFRRLLFATNFSAGAPASAREAFLLADEFGADVDVMHVGEPPDPDALQRLVAASRRGGGTVRTFTPEGDPTDAIVRHAASHDVDLIVLGVHPHSALARHLRTGPAFQVVLQASCPVLTVSADIP